MSNAPPTTHIAARRAISPNLYEAYEQLYIDGGVTVAEFNAILIASPEFAKWFGSRAGQRRMTREQCIRCDAVETERQTKDAVDTSRSQLLSIVKHLKAAAGMDVARQITAAVLAEVEGN